jgi:hypothetical protein
VTDSSRYRIRICRDAARRGSRRGRVTMLVVLAGAIVALSALPASAAGSGDVTVSLSTVSQAVKSVTVSPTSTTYDRCTNGTSTTTALGFPNGACAASQAISVTNGNTPATILVNGADMVPSDNGAHWTLVNTVNASADHYYETVGSTNGFNSGPTQVGGTFQALSNAAACDTVFFPGCNSAAGQHATENLAVTGPSTSSDTSTSWSTSIIWTAS